MMLVRVEGLTPRQQQIADLLWVADTDDALRTILRMFGDEAKLVQEMIVLAAIDQVEDVDLANNVIDFIRSK
jgi:hypothetical protein